MIKDASMSRELVILIVEDDPGHSRLIEKNLQRANLHNTILRFEDGQEVLDFFFGRGDGAQLANGSAYLVLLDIRMPKVDGVEVLRRLKADKALRKLPIIMLSTTDDPREIARCHELGCSSYILKPVDYEKFSEAVKKLGLLIRLIEVPVVRTE
jgi:CheY-like chemotaxis protein